MNRREGTSLPRFRGRGQFTRGGRWALVVARQPGSRSRRQTGPAVGGYWVGNRQFRFIFEADIFEIPNIREGGFGTIDLGGVEGGGLGGFGAGQLGWGIRG